VLLDWNQSRRTASWRTVSPSMAIFLFLRNLAVSNWIDTRGVGSQLFTSKDASTESGAKELGLGCLVSDLIWSVSGMCGERVSVGILSFLPIAVRLKSLLEDVRIRKCVAEHLLQLSASAVGEVFNGANSLLGSHGG
jgi:hypothetical protein